MRAHTQCMIWNNGVTVKSQNPSTKEYGRKQDGDVWNPLMTTSFQHPSVCYCQLNVVAVQRGAIQPDAAAEKLEYVAPIFWIL